MLCCVVLYYIVLYCIVSYGVHVLYIRRADIADHCVSRPQPKHDKHGRSTHRHLKSRSHILSDVKKWGATATRDLPQKSFLICHKYTHNSLRSFFIFFTVIHFSLPWVNTPFMHQYIKGVPVLPSFASKLDKGAALGHRYIVFITFCWPKKKYFKTNFWWTHRIMAETF